MTRELKKLNQKAAGIDIGSEKIFISVEGEEEVRSFETFTDSLKEASKYLKEHEVKSVAMEATGVYWIPLYEILEESGIMVNLVNGYHVKNVPGRKTDVQDCQWIQQLHSYGLLKGSFIPEEKIRELRSYVRQRGDYIEMGASHIQHMQKALDQMNIKLHNVISQIVGVSGLRIIRAIISGERDVNKLVMMCDTQILKKKEAEVKRSLMGNYKREHIFLLKQSLECWEFYQNKIQECDSEIAEILKEISADKEDKDYGKGTKTIKHHKPNISDLHNLMMKITEGKDATVLPGITDLTLMRLISEVGTDMSNWKTEKHFTSWIGVAPNSHRSGKGFKKKKGKKKTKVGQIFRECAQSIARSKYLALGGFYRRIKSRSGAKVAIVATARKLAELFYRFMRYGRDYIEYGLKSYEEKYRERILKNLKTKAKILGYEVIPTKS
jgi:transposase